MLLMWQLSKVELWDGSKWVNQGKITAGFHLVRRICYTIGFKHSPRRARCYKSTLKKWGSTV